MLSVKTWQKPRVVEPDPLVPVVLELAVPVEVEVAVDFCHSGLSVVNNEWGFSKYPVVPGHKVAGRVVALRRQHSRAQGFASAPLALVEQLHRVAG